MILYLLGGAKVLLFSHIYKFFCIFIAKLFAYIRKKQFTSFSAFLLLNYLHISEKSSNFAADLKKSSLWSAEVSGSPRWWNR